VVVIAAALLKACRKPSCSCCRTRQSRCSSILCWCLSYSS
jgi:hypothetical protein